MIADSQSLAFMSSKRPNLMSHTEENQLHKVDSILACFSQLEDPRSPINRVHLLGDLVVICIMAVIAGADGPQAIGIWARANQEWLKKRLELPGGIPSHDTLGRLLTALRPDVFQECFQTWVKSFASLDDDTLSNQIAIDGKVLRRSHDKRNGLGPLWLVSAWAVDQSLSLGQLATDEKSKKSRRFLSCSTTLN